MTEVPLGFLLGEELSIQDMLGDEPIGLV